MKGLRPCSQVPDKRAASECMNDFVPQMFLGQGEQGTVIEASVDQRIVVVKIMPFGTESVAEVKAQCLLDGLRQETSVFAHAYGWQVCKTIPESWIFYIGNKRFPKASYYLFLVMEEAPKKWTDWENLNIQEEEFKALLFLLLHGIYVGRKRFQFLHDDLGPQNLMLQTKQPGPIHVRVGKQVFSVESSAPQQRPLRFVPKIIDFGYTEYGEEENGSDEDDSLFETEATPATDLSSLEHVFPNGMMQAFFDMSLFKKAKMSSRSDYKAIKDLLMSPFFAEYATDKTNVGKMCIVCMREATHVHKRDQTYFCGAACAFNAINIM